MLHFYIPVTFVFFVIIVLLIKVINIPFYLVDDFNADCLQPGFRNPRAMCYLNSVMILCHRLQIRTHLYDDYGNDEQTFRVFR